MAGAGYKLFSTGEVLTAANVNTYLMQQTVMVFASAAARTTALSGVLAEGMISYRSDSKVLEIYNGTSWVDFSGDITGVTTAANSGLAGGATSGTVALTLATTAKGDVLVGTGSGTAAVLPIGTTNQTIIVDSTTTTGVKYANGSVATLTAKGDILVASAANTPARQAVGSNGYALVADSSTSTGLAYSQPSLNLIYSGSFSGATVHTFDSVFDSTYDNYKIIVDITSTSGTDTDIGIGLRKSGVGSVNFDSSTYQYQYAGTATNGTAGTGLVSTGASGYPSLCSFVTELISPFIAVNTMAMTQAHGINSLGQPRRFHAAGYKFNTDQYFGFLVQSSSGNIGGKIRIYGYKN